MLGLRAPICNVRKGRKPLPGRRGHVLLVQIPRAREIRNDFGRSAAAIVFRRFAWGSVVFEAHPDDPRRVVGLDRGLAQLRMHGAEQSTLQRKQQILT